MRYLKLLSFMIAFIVFLMVFSSNSSSAVAQTDSQDDEMAQIVIERINEWRISEGVWPLKPNDTLTRMALDQAIYVLSQPEVPENIHLGKQGENPRERALFEPYQWPHYSLPGQVAIGENAGSGTLNFAMNFWRNSPTHHDTALNPAYREIGVAALPNKTGHFFLVVFGSRPDMLPALVHGQKLYLANEKFEYARFYDSIQEVTQIQVFDSGGESLTEGWIPWTKTLDLPGNVSDKVFVLYSDGSKQVLSEVEFDRDRALLPGDEIAGTDAAPVAATPVPSVVEPTPTEVPAIVVDPPQPDEVDVRIIYTEDTLNILNVSGAPLDISGLLLTTGSRNLPVAQFSRVADISLTELPNNHCLQARSSAIQGEVVLPAGCTWVRSLLYVTPDQLFWNQAAEFTVSRGEVTLAACVRSAEECLIDLP